MWREEGKVCNFSLMAARFSWFNWQLDFIIVAMVKVTPPSAEGNLSVHNSISSAWAKTEWRVYQRWEEYSNVNFLQTHLMSSLIPALQGFMTAGLFNLLILLGVLMSAFWVHCAKVLWIKLAALLSNPCMWRKIWWSLFTTGSGGQSAHRTTFGVN